MLTKVLLRRPIYFPTPRDLPPFRGKRIFVAGAFRDAFWQEAQIDLAESIEGAYLHGADAIGLVLCQCKGAKGKHQAVCHTSRGQGRSRVKRPIFLKLESLISEGSALNPMCNPSRVIHCIASIPMSRNK